MKQTTRKKIILLGIVCTSFGLALNGRSAHSTTFLDVLQTEVANRLAETNLTAAKQRALNSANRTLNRTTTSLSSDLGLLSSSAATLNATFSDDAALAAAELASFNQFLGEANAQFTELQNNSNIGTNGPPPALANQITQAENALTNARNESNSIPVRVRALTLALNKIRVANILAARTIKAPASLSGKEVGLTGRESDHDRVDVTLASNGTYDIPAMEDEAAELGLWTYQRTGANTGQLRLMPTTAGTEHVLNLKFSSSTKGTFTGTTNSGDGVSGKFSVRTP